MAKSLRWRLALAVLGPLAFLALLEGGLRLAGYGYTPRLLIPDPAGGRLTTNPEFGRLFFPRALARRPEPLWLDHPKPAGEFRIGVLGESAALGFPDPAFGFARQLDVLLAGGLAGRRCVVVNLAMTAINSHALPIIAREALAAGCDALVILAGNNEVVGPFGAGTVFDRTQPARWRVRLTLWLRGRRVGQLLSALRERLAGPSTASWQGLAMFVDHPVADDDPRLLRTRAAFRANLEDVLRQARHAGVPVLLCTVPVNLLDCPPFADGPDGAAGAAYAGGRARLAAGDPAGALAELSRARDLDRLRFRIDRPLQAVLRDLGHAPGVTLIDAEQAFAADGPPGSDLFHEHVHFTFAGDYLLARLLADALATRFGGAPPWASPDEVARALAFTPFDEARVAGDVAAMTRRPPFLTQSGHEDRQIALVARVARLSQRARRETEATRLQYEEALRARPTDFRLHLNQARFLRDSGAPAAEARDAWAWVARHLPTDQAAHIELALATARAGDPARARALLQPLVRHPATAAEAEMALGDLALEEGRYDEAATCYRNVLVEHPDHLSARINLGVACQRRGAWAEAEQHYRIALTRQRAPATLANLGNLMIHRKRYAEARDLLAEAQVAGLEDASISHNLGLAELSLGHFEAALRQFDEALRRQSDHPRAGALRGWALAYAGRLPEALDQFRAVLTRTFDPTAASGVALVLAAAPDPALRDPPTARTILDRLTREAPAPFAQLMEAQAALAAADGNYAEASARADRAAELFDAEGGGALAGQVRARSERYRASQPALAADPCALKAILRGRDRTWSSPAGSFARRDLEAYA